jgi:hypothetical protein
MKLLDSLHKLNPTEDAIDRGLRAQQLVDDPLFVEAWEGLEAGAIQRLAACSVTDVMQLQQLALSLQTIRALRSRMQTWILHGQEAARRQELAESKPPSALTRFTRGWQR